MILGTVEHPESNAQWTVVLHGIIVRIPGNTVCRRWTLATGAQTALMAPRGFDDDHRGGRGVPAQGTAGVGTS